MFPNHDPQNLDLLQIRRKLIIGYDPSFGSQKRLYPFLLNFGVLLLECVRESEGYYGKSFQVNLGTIFVNVMIRTTASNLRIVIITSRPLKARFPSVDVTQDSVPSCALQSPAQKPCILQVRQGYRTVS